MNIHYLEILTFEVPFSYIISFFSKINFECMSSLVYTVYYQKQPSEQRCSVKKGVLKNFVNFVGKHLRWSLFLITFWPGNYFEEHLPTTAFVLHWHPSLLLIRFTIFSAPSSSSSLLLLSIPPMFVFGSNSKCFKEFKSSISFSLKPHFHCCYFIFPCFFCLSHYLFIFSCRCP